MGTTLTDQPVPGESLFGFLLRRSNDHGMHGVRSLIAAAGIPLDGKMGVAPIELFDFADPLGRFLGVDPDALRTMGYGPGPDGRRKTEVVGFGGRILPRISISPNRLRVCPCCLEEARFAKAIWDVPLVAACPKHRIVLVDHCDRCGRPIATVRRAPHVCRCGWPLRKLKRIPADEGVVKLVSKLHTSLGCDIDGAPDPSSNSPFKFADLCELIWALARISRPDGIPGVSRLLAAHSPGTFCDLLADASWQLEDWPTRVQSAFYKEEYGDFRKRIQPSKKRADWPIQLIHRLPDGPARTLLSEAWYSRPNARSRALPEGLALLDRCRRGKLAHLTTGEVRRILGVSSQVVGSLESRGVLTRGQSSIRRHAKWDIDQVSALCEWEKSALYDPGFRRTDLDRAIVERMADLTGMSVRRASRTIQNTDEGQFGLRSMTSDLAGDVLSRLERRLDECFRQMPCLPEDGHATLWDIVKAHRRYRGMSWSRALELFTDGTISPCARTGLHCTVGDLLFHRSWLEPNCLTGIDIFPPATQQGDEKSADQLIRHTIDTDARGPNHEKSPAADPEMTGSRFKESII